MVKSPPTKKYICSFCARPFSRSEHKLRHERSHTNTKPFNCTKCNSCFVRRDLMQRHLRTVHKIDLKSIQNGKIETVPQVQPVQQVVLTKDVNKVTELLTISKNLNSLNIQLNNQISTLSFVYGTSNIPIQINNENIYACLCYSSSLLDLNDCVKLFNKALLTPNLNSLTILSWTYLLNYDKLSNHLLPIDIVLNQLDTLLNNEIDEVNEDLLWFINHLQALYILKFNKQAPLSIHFYLQKSIDSIKLIEWLKILSKNSNILPMNEANQKILLNSLIFEFQNLKFNNLDLNLNKIEIHNSIIMFNKFYISKIIQFGYNINSQFNKIFRISKRNLLLNVPQFFQDLIIDYVLIPFDSNHLNLLTLTLKEYQYLNQIKPLNNNTNQWFNDLNIITINNNLGLFSYPLLVLGSLPLNLLNSDLDFKDLIIPNFLILIKIFMNFENTDEFKNNVILKGAIYLILEMNDEVKVDYNDFNFQDIKQKLFENLFKIFKNWLDFYKVDLNLTFFKNTCFLNSPIEKKRSLSISDDDQPGLNLNYTYFNNNLDSKIKLPPLNLNNDNLSKLNYISIPYSL